MTATAAFAETYYVRTDGSNSNDGLSNSSSGAWLTIDYAADHVSAGDVIRVQEGGYVERVSPAVNGSSVDSTVTFVADGDVTVNGFDFTDSSYIRVIGFLVDSDAGGMAMDMACVNLYGTNDHLEFWNNTFRDAVESGIRGRLPRDGTTNNTLVIGNTFLNFGIGNGSGAGVSMAGSHNLLAYNELSNMHPDGFIMFTSFNQFLNNYTHDFSEASGGHSDNFQTGSTDIGWHDNLIEGTFQQATGIWSDEHTSMVQNYQPSLCGGDCGPFEQNIYRNNVWHNVSEGTLGFNQAQTGPIDNIYVYNNTTVESVRQHSSIQYGSVVAYGGNLHNYFILNNIEYEAWGVDTSSGVMVYYLDLDPYTLDYNLAFDPDGDVTFSSPWTGQANALSNVDPALNDVANDDFTLRSSSGAIGAGGALTVTNGGGSGTTFNVVANGGGFFRGDDPEINQYGGNLVVGDTITVGGDTLTIASISGDSITVDQSFTWADGEGVYFGDDSTPDIGAYPYIPDGFLLGVTYHQSGGTVTATPSVPELVRFVVVYEDGIPVGVDSVAPYSVSGVGDGVVEVRAYPRYPSKTLWASSDAPLPPPPDRLRVRVP